MLSNIFTLQVNWENILERWGWPTLILFAVIVFIAWSVRTALIPAINRYIDRAEKQADEVQNILKDRAQTLETTQTSLLREFSKTLEAFKEILEASNRRAEKQVEMLTEVLTEVRIINRLQRRGELPPISN